EKDLVNDLLGFQQALVEEAGITPSGVPEKVGASDLLDSLKALIYNQSLGLAVSNWTARSAAGSYSGTFRGVAWSGSLFVAGGSSGEIQTSPDGVRWTARSAAGGFSGTFWG